jgi:dolichyl-phosphate-mannose-protein mannosyltransferase
VTNRRASTSGTPTSGSARVAALLLVTVVLVLVAWVRFRLAEVPLERDEGEYAYAGQLILQGIPPYREAYNMKFPGAYYAYALVMAVFGQTVAAIRWGLILVNAATALLVFAIARRGFGLFAGTVAAIAFSLLSLDLWIMGVFAHATHFVLLPALAGLLLLLRARARRGAFGIVAGSALLGIALLVKQHAFVFLPLGALTLIVGVSDEVRQRKSWIPRDLGLLAAGAILPLVVTGVVFAAQGVLATFWSWTFDYAGAYVSEVPFRRFVPNLLAGLETVTRATKPIWVAGAVGLLALWLGGWGRAAKVLLTALLVMSFVAIVPGLYFREHYFILLLPAVAILVGVAFETAARWIERIVPAAVSRTLAAVAFAALIAVVSAGEGDFLFRMSPTELSRARYGSNPFPESAAIASYIRERTKPGDRIAVLGSEPQIYFLAGRRSATGYIYMYPLMEPQPHAARMQEEVIRQVEAAHPRYVVLVQLAMSWLPRSTSSRRIIEWANLYTNRCYDLVGITDIASVRETRFVWDDQVAGYQPTSNNLIYVFRAKSDEPCGTGP